MEIIVLGKKIETKSITSIHEVERDKKMFLNREAGFIITFMGGYKETFKENIPYDTYPNEISRIKEKWEKLQNEVTDQWQRDKHQLPEFGFE